MIKAISESAPLIPMDFLCRHFAASRSGYYKWARAVEPTRLVTKRKICSAIKDIFYASGKTYGSPRIWDDLIKRGFTVSENTVAKYMREMRLDARLKKKFRVQTTDSNHRNPIADRLFKVEDHHSLPKAPNEIIAGDITYLRLGQSFRYLAVVMDIHTREILGWSLQRNLKTSLVLDALDMAMKKVGPDVEVIFHSDRGSQYASDAYRKFCESSSIKLSMSRRGNCFDNAYVESWFSSFKKERLYRKTYNNEAELRALVFDYIEVWYNRRRKHSALGNLSPLEFKESQTAARC